MSTRSVYVVPDSGEFFVKVGGRYVEDGEYVDGGGIAWAEDEFDALELVGRFTDQQIVDLEHTRTDREPEPAPTGVFVDGVLIATTRRINL